jgi:hypothetical protein
MLRSVPEHESCVHHTAGAKLGLMRGALVSALVVAALAAAASPALGARTIKAQPDRFWAVTYLGGWHVAAHPEYPKAVHALGTPSHIKNPDIPGCEATWKRLGLRIQFESFGIAHGCNEGKAQSAVVKGHRGRVSWRTQAGLRVGDSFAKLKRLYPDARRKPGARVIVYQDEPVIGDGSIITAVIRHQRVASLRLWLGGAGE